MFLSREIDKQLGQNCTKIHIYIQFCIKVVGLKRSYSTNMNQSKNDYMQQDTEIFRFVPFIIFSFLFCIFNRNN